MVLEMVASRKLEFVVFILRIAKLLFVKTVKRLQILVVLQDEKIK